MPKFIMPLLAATFLTAVALPTPAAAMELREAIKRCDASAGCTYTLDGSGATIFGPKGGIVSCPPQKGSQCGVIGAPAPNGGKPTRATGNVNSILKGSGPGMAKTPTTPTKITEDKKKIGSTQVEGRQSNSTAGSGGSKKH